MSNDTQKLLDIIARQKRQIASLDKKLHQAQQKAVMATVYLETILEKSPEHLYWLDKESRVIMCNAQQALSYGLASAKELIRLGIPEITQLLGWSEDIANQLRQNNLEILTTKQETTLEEAIFIDGKERIFQSSKKPLHDESGSVIGIFGISVDITERKRLERELQLAEDRANAEKLKYSIYLDNILANVPEHLYLIDKNEIVLICNDKQARSFGFQDKSEVIGKSMRELAKNMGWSEEMIHRIHNNNTEVIQARQGIIIEEESIYEDEHKILLSYKNPLIDKEGEVIGILGVTVDITERKRIEEELISTKEKLSRVNQAKTKLLALAGDYLTESLDSIPQLITYLQNKETQSDRKKELAEANQSLNELLQLLAKIQELPKAQDEEVLVEDILSGVELFFHGTIELLGLVARLCRKL